MTNDNKPVYRVDVLRKAASKDGYHELGVCDAIHNELIEYGFADYDSSFSRGKESDYDVKRFFPLYTFENAQKFGAAEYEGGFWFNKGEWGVNGKRTKFLNWLIEQYKEDKTDLRLIQREYLQEIHKQLKEEKELLRVKEEADNKAKQIEQKINEEFGYITNNTTIKFGEAITFSFDYDSIEGVCIIDIMEVSKEHHIKMLIPLGELKKLDEMVEEANRICVEF